MPIKPVKSDSDRGRELLASLKHRFATGDDSCVQAVTDIINQVRDRGDEAIVEYARKFDSPRFSADKLRVTPEEIGQARERVSSEFLSALDLAAGRVRDFHEREKEQSWIVTRPDGATTGRLVRPVDSAGLYVPGGQGGSTPLVSSVLMNGIPAVIAGVGRIIMSTPPDGEGMVNPALLVAAATVGIHEIYKMGSAWAIAALAFGTKTVPCVDVIVGPGNRYVTEAKRQVAGRVRIDMIAGPSEVLILADETARPSFLAADMLAQAEHDPLALSMLVTTSADIAQETVRELNRQLATLPRQDIARRSLTTRGVILLVEEISEAIAIANTIAAEHLELMIQDPMRWLGRIRHAGAIFLGHFTPEAAGDYVAGPNHVLPTMGTARFSSALGVETFVKKSSIISYDRETLRADAPHLMELAALEGLTAHGRSVAIRLAEGK